jgi:hypothetical protein
MHGLAKFKHLPFVYGIHSAQGYYQFKTNYIEKVDATVTLWFCVQ